MDRLIDGLSLERNKFCNNNKNLTLQSLRFKLLPNGADGAHDGLHRAAGDVLPRAWLTFEGRCDDGADRALTRPKHGFESRPGVAHPDPRTLASVKQDPQDRRVFRNLKFVFVF